MTWLINNPMEERYKFVLFAKEPEANMAELCREFGISRQCGYKWLKRYEKLGLQGLKEMSRKPHACANEVRPEMVCKIVSVKALHSAWGGRKIASYLRREGIQPPAIRTIDRVLERCGLIKKRKRRRKKFFSTEEVVQAEYANHVWTVDFKGEWKTEDGTVVYPLTIRDEFSKKILALEILDSRATEPVKSVFERCFDKFGLPEFIRSDNGNPFAFTRALCGLTRLSVWWLSLGIIPNRIPPASPQCNPGHERMHRDIKEELQIEPGKNQKHQQEIADQWREDYNSIRPHQALNDRVPSEVYKLSSRKYHQEKVTYDYPQRFHLRRVLSHGKINWRGGIFFVSKALAGQTIGLQVVNSKKMNIWFNEFLLASVDPHFNSDLIEYQLKGGPIKIPKAA